MEQALDGPITKDMTIGDLVQSYPSVTEILLDEGVHCVGCGAAYFETIEQGLAGHGKTAEEINAIVSKLNKAIPEEKGNDDLTVTQPAITKLKEIIKDEKEGTFLRIKVLKGGCSGSQYEFSLEKEKFDTDDTIEVDGLKIVIDKDSLAKMKGAKIDYIDSLTGAGFKVTNPNAASTCGCGQSFS